MAITKRDPNTIHLKGMIEYENDYVAIEEILPGKLLSLHDDSGEAKWGVHDTPDDPIERVVALEQDEWNLTVDDVYAAGDLVKAGVFKAGGMFWGLVPSGQNIARGDHLQSNGDGTFKALATGVAAVVAEEGTGGAVTELTRIRLRFL